MVGYTEVIPKRHCGKFDHTLASLKDGSFISILAS